MTTTTYCFNRASLGRARNVRHLLPAPRQGRASIGPRSEERGTSWAHPRTWAYEMLQSGLARKSEERGRRSGGASSRSGFNRASLGRARNGRCRNSRGSPRHSLQSGLARKSEERGSSGSSGRVATLASIGPRSEERGTLDPRDRRVRPGVASIGPRSEERGTGASARTRPRRCRLQSGLARKSEERPVPLDSPLGPRMLQSGLARKSEERSPAARAARRACALQSGLARKSEERRIGPPVGHSPDAASIGPRSEERGTLRRARHCITRWLLQSGLARKSEERSNSPTLAVSFVCFNRASLGRARNEQRAERVHRDLLASIGPRSEERGTARGLDGDARHPRRFNRASLGRARNGHAGRADGVRAPASIGPRSEERGTGGCDETHLLRG